MASDQAISPFTFTWTTNNFHKESVVSLDSPVFTAESIYDTKWSLSLYVEGWQLSTPGYITCDIQRENDESGLDHIHINFQISILDGKGVALNTVREEGCPFVMPSLASGAPYRVSKALIQIKTFLENFDKYVPRNTFTIRCRMWRFENIIPRTDLCFARTLLDVEKRSFIWTLEKVFFISSGQKRTILVPPFSKGSFPLQLNLCLKKNDDEENFSIEMYKVKDLKHLCCEISMIGSEGKIVKCERTSIKNVTFVDNKCLLFQIFVRKRDLEKDRNFFLTDGAMILQCDFQFSFGVAWNQIENYRQQQSEIDAAVENEETALTSFPCHSSCSSKKILECLLKEGTLSDISLRAGTKTFPVHKSILSARSVVFRSKFLRDAVENPSIIMDLPDLDERNLQSLLLYIYTDVVEDLEFENAMELYQSADKYQLTDLKNICAKFLIGSLCRSNIFQVLSFANIYKDNKIKLSAQDFISDIGNDFTSSEEWQDFKKRNLELAMETMEYMISRKRIKTDK